MFHIAPLVRILSSVPTPCLASWRVFTKHATVSRTVDLWRIAAADGIADIVSEALDIVLYFAHGSTKGCFWGVTQRPSRAIQLFVTPANDVPTVTFISTFFRTVAFISFAAVLTARIQLCINALAFAVAHV